MRIRATIQSSDASRPAVSAQASGQIGVQFLPELLDGNFVPESPENSPSDDPREDYGFFYQDENLLIATKDGPSLRLAEVKSGDVIEFEFTPIRPLDPNPDEINLEVFRDEIKSLENNVWNITRISSAY